MEGRRVWKSSMVERHTSGFCETKFSKYISNHDIVHIILFDTSSLYGSSHNLIYLAMVQCIVLPKLTGINMSSG
jgi:hypothetical protein